MEDKKMPGRQDSQKKDRRSKKPYIVSLVFILIVFLLNHLEYHFRARSLAETAIDKGAVVIKAETNGGGHATIGVDEAFINNEKNSKINLRFSTLGAWNYDPLRYAPCPESIKKLDGKAVTSVGFMYPLESGPQISLFALLRTTQTCCYGPKPQYNQYLFVELQEPVKYERMRPVIVEGSFFVDPRPDEGYIYRLEAVSVKPVTDKVADVDAAQAAQKVGLELFDFALLENLKERSVISSELEQLDNTQVVVEGFLVGSTEDDPPGQIVGKYWWDGVMKGTRPDFYNAVMISPKDLSQIPPAWKQKVVFTGILNITRDKSQYADNGIISIKEAVRGVPEQGAAGAVFNAGPFLSVWHEVLILAIFFITILRKFVFSRRSAVAVICVLVLSGANMKPALAVDKGKGKIAATVNGVPIYEKQVKANLPENSFGASLKHQRRLRLDNLIYTKVLMQFLDKEKILIDDKLIEKEIDYLKKYPPASVCICHTFESLEQFMQANNYTMDDLSNEIRVNMGLEAYMDKLWHQKYETEKKRSDLLKENRLAMEALYINVSHIFFSFLQDAEYEIKPAKVESKLMGKALIAHKRLNKGEKFKALAKELSEDITTRDKGGDLGFIEKKMFGKEFAKTAENLSSGQYSKPVKSAWGVHIIKRNKNSDQIIMDKLKRDFREDEQPFLIKELMDKAKIVRY